MFDDSVTLQDFPSIVHRLVKKLVRLASRGDYVVIGHSRWEVSYCVETSIVHRICLGILLLPALMAPISATADWRDPAFIIDSFFEIALKNEYSATGLYVRKWPNKGISYYYVHRVADNHLHEELTDLHLRHLEKITGLPIKQVKNAAGANLIIVFSPEDTLKNDLHTYLGMQSEKQRDEFFRNSVCLGRFSAGSDGSIQKAAVVIPVDRARHHAKLVDCIVEELTQVLGLPNDSEKVFPSIFNDRSVDYLLSGLDYILLKILYDPRLRPGMDKTQALPVVTTVVAELARKGIIERADILVQEGGLYPLLN